MTVNIYMVRHGETYFNLLHRFQGWSDAPLTEKEFKTVMQPVLDWPTYTSMVLIHLA